MKKKLLIIAVLTLLTCVFVACNPGVGMNGNDADSGYVTVTFDTQGGDKIAAQKIEKGGYAIKPTNDPQKDGYEFVDWYTQRDGGEKFDFAMPIMQNTTIYAVYIVHEHTYDTDKWIYDTNYHWHMSTCGHPDVVADKQKHDYLGNICKICGYENDEEHIHVLDYHTSKKATCTEPGNIAYWECPRCGKYFSDSAGENEIDISNVKIDAMGHEYDNATGSWSWNDEYTQATYAVKCSRCDDEKLYTAQGKDIIEGESAEPTCTASGYIYYSARVTIDSVEYVSKEIKKTVSSLGHDYVNGEWDHNTANHWKVCARCKNPGDRTLHSFGDSGVCECGMVEIAPINEFRFISLGNNTWRLANYTGNRQIVSIPSEYNRGTVVAISDNAFKDCDKIETLIIPDTITSIGTGAFHGCTNLKEITISDNIETIGAGAFKDSSLITKAALPANALDYILKDNLESVTVTSGEIAENAFANCTSLNSVIIKSAVTAVGKNAFANCAQLTNIKIEHGIKSIGENAFKGCSALSNIAVPNSVTSIGSAAFSGCSGLESLTLPFAGGTANAKTPSASTLFGYIFGTESYAGSFETVQLWGTETTQQAVYYIPNHLASVSIGGNILYGTFYGCDRIESIVITNSKLTSLGDYAFYNCVNLNNITIPESVINIGALTFAYCLLLEDIEFSENTSFVGADAMMESSWYASQPDGLVYIGKTLYAYKGNMSNGAKIVIADGTKSISEYAFAGLNNFSITIPSSVVDIGESSFENCTFESIVCVGNHLAYFTRNSSSQITITSGYIQNEALKDWNQLKSLTLMSGVKSLGTSAFEGCSGLTAVTIPDSVTSIGSSAFSGCSGLTSVTIPDSVTSIGSSAFSGCSGLTSITIPDSVTSIGDSAFSGCTGLTTVNWNATACTSTGSYNSPIFSNCTNLSTVNIGENVTTISSYAFRGCSGLTEIYYNGDIAAWCGISGLSNLMPSSITLYIGGKKIEGELVIPDSVTSIGDYAFRGCSGLTSVTIPDSVTSIGGSAFRGCSGLTEITIPFVGATKDETSETHFGYIFGASDNSDNDNYVPTSLKKVIITGGTSIGNYAFYGCSSLTSITIPDSVTRIGGSAFSGCSGLTSITIPDSVTSIGSSAFYRCSGLESITVEKGNSVYHSAGNCLIETKSKTLIAGCNNSVIPADDSVTRIGGSAFYACRGLTEIVIPDSVTSIGDSAFSGCTGLTTVNWNATACTSAGSYNYFIFEGCTNLSTVNIGENVTTISYYAFRGCSGLTTVNWNATACTSAGSYNYLIFEGCTNLSTVNIGENVTVIPSYAFEGCSGLTSITIPDEVTSIGDDAFRGCSGLTSITIPDEVTSIGGSAFRGCSGLTSVTIGNGVTSIGDSAFSGCTGLTTVNWNATACTSAGSSDYPIFSNCTNLSTVNIGENVTVIPSYAFRGCSGLTSITIPDSVTSIGRFAFDGCSGLTSVTIPDSVTSIGGAAFRGCSGLTEITIPFVGATKDETSETHFGYIFGASDNSDNDNYVPTSLKKVIITGGTSIGNYAFYGCSSLTSITIPDSVTSIGDSAFSGCTGLTTVNWNATACTSTGSYNSPIFSNCTNLSTVNIGENVTTISSYAFRGCSGLTSITIPDEVTSIGDYAFDGCSGLTSVTIPDSVTSIGDSALAYCDGLTSVTIPDSVTSIGNSAFEGCSGLTSVTIPDSVTSIGNSAFYGCSRLTSITIPFVGAEAGKTSSDTNQYPFGYIFATSPYTGSTAVRQSYHGSSTSNPTYGTYYIPSSLRSVTVTGGNILRGAFDHCSMLTSITIPGSVTSIGNSAFEGCSGLTSVTIPDSVTSIGNSAFYGCSRLTEIYYNGDIAAWCGISGLITLMSSSRILYIGGKKIEGELVIPDSVTSIGNSAFRGCSGLTSITIPDEVTSIGDDAFRGCSGLTSVTIGNGVTSIGDSAFSGCTGLTTVNWNATACTSAGSYNYFIFEGCTNLSTVNIGENVTVIPSYAFRGCSGLTSITIPDSVTSIGDSALAYCDGLTSVTYDGTKAQWNAIDKGYNWDYSSYIEQVICTDGMITL